jgi:hypothetical protein
MMIHTLQNLFDMQCASMPYMQWFHFHSTHHYSDRFVLDLHTLFHRQQQKKVFQYVSMRLEQNPAYMFPSMYHWSDTSALH